MDIQNVLNDAVKYAAERMEGGKPAAYIPELAKEDPRRLGACISMVDGRSFTAGDWDHDFTMQSISKTITLIMALEKLGEEYPACGADGIDQHHKHKQDLSGNIYAGHFHIP